MPKPNVPGSKNSRPPDAHTLRNVNNPRELMLGWMEAALAAVDPSRCVVAVLRDFPTERVAVLALGKAATGMSLGARDALNERIERALIIAPQSSNKKFPAGWQFRPGDHPLPGANSLLAGEAIESWLSELEPDLHLLVLLSGGGSALAELPVAGMTLANLQAMNRWLLASGLDIRAVNAIRARFSRLKQGGLLRLAGKRGVTGFVISDVPGDRVENVASGPLSPDLLQWPDVVFPDWLQSLHTMLPRPPDEPPNATAELRIVARNDDALDAIEQGAAKENIPCVMRETLSGDAEEAGVRIGKRLREGGQGLYLFGGETSVRLPEKPGRGGRNQQLALAAAQEIAGTENIYLLASGTDGIDGNTEDAGALVDGETTERVRAAGLEPYECLAAANANAALTEACDVLHTGPTGTNVADIVIALKTSSP